MLTIYLHRTAFCVILIKKQGENYEQSIKLAEAATGKQTHIRKA